MWCVYQMCRPVHVGLDLGEKHCAGGVSAISTSWFKPPTMSHCKRMLVIETQCRSYVTHSITNNTGVCIRCITDGFMLQQEHDNHVICTTLDVSVALWTNPHDMYTVVAM